jgi:hypothetical protein
MARPRYCHECQTCLISLASVSLCGRCEERHRIPRSARTSDRCSTCKRIRPVHDFPLDRNNIRMLSCSACLSRLRDSYRERKGKPVSREGRARRFRQAQRTVERALRVRIREEKLKRHWLRARERWEQGELTEGWGITRRQIESWQRGEEYCEGPYRQWVGYTDPRESSTGVGESLPEDFIEGRESSQGEGSQGEEGWEGLTDEEGSSAGLQDGWGGFPGENEAWEGSTGENEAREGPREGRKGSTGRSEAWEGPQESRESSIAPVNSPQEPQETQESPQEQYCSSCNRKKPLSDFGQFFTCNKCRERNRRANQARHARYKANYLNKSS